jgi:hypothetical protein
MKIIAICLILLGSTGFRSGTARSSDIYKRYKIKETTAHFKDALLVLYSDHTYVNFGIIYAGVNDIYVWHSSGSWTEQNKMMVLKKNDGIFDLELLKKDIKRYYKGGPNYRFFKQSFQYISDNFKERAFSYENSELVDNRKNISYREVKK